MTFLVSDSKGNPIGQYTSDQNGYVYIDKTLTDGKYLVREIQAADGYVLDTTVKTFYVEYGATSTITWKNTPTMGQIQITKKSADDNPYNAFAAGTPLPGATFEVYDRAGNLVNTVVTNKNGIATTDTLPLGRYTIRETKAPVFYSATTQPIEVEIEFSGQIVRVEVLNQSVYTNVSVTKRGYKQVTPSQTIRYDFKNIANNSTVPLNSFYWRDTLPTSAVRLTKIITGTWNQRLSYKVVYKTNLHDYRTLADNLSTMKNYSLDASPAALGLASNEYVTDFMFAFGTVKAGFAQVDAPRVLELAHRYPWVVAAVGIHPESLLPAADCGEEGPAPTVSVYGGDWAAEMRALMPYYADPKVVAVGECGLDYHWPVPKDAQLAMFEAHIRLALELDKPIIVHDRNAHADVYALLKKYQPKGIVHCYSGSADDAVWLAKQGLFIGFGGACTFKGAKRAAKAISALPLESIVLETDCPYMAPEPVRGIRCDSSLIRYVGEYIAQLRGISAEEVFRTTAENARRVYGL